MKSGFLFPLLLVSMQVQTVFGHGWSEQMRQELNASPPEWLSIGEAIKVEPDETATKDKTEFRPRSGGVTNSRNRVQIPERGIEIRLDHAIDWTGNNEAGTGASLSPDGTKLILNSGMTSRFLEILPNGSHREIELRLPHVTYDNGSKGWITGWSWADDQTLVGNAEIDTEQGEFVERRLYAFHVKESVMSRLNLDALNLPTTEGLRVSKIGLDLDRLKISVGDSEITVKADLKSPPKIAIQAKEAPTSITPPTLPPQASPTPEKPTKESKSFPLWSLIIALILAALMLLWLKRRRQPVP